jgi:hypothetical protein
VEKLEPPGAGKSAGAAGGIARATEDYTNL